ncbi:MAG: HAD hydrolase-like protein [Kiritimatiellae bacterium]|nr:HAD hydrolase-like protein [Kiritimatiellia bacterium]
MKRFCFFDLDGTLADTDPDIRGAWKAALRDLGLECPEFDAKFVAGPPIDEMTRTLFPERFTQALADAVRQGFAAHYDHDGFPETREYPGVLDEVRRLKAEGRTVAIVTNKRFAAAEAMSRHFGWDAVFDGVYAGDMFCTPEIAARFGATPGVKVRKPDLLRRVIAACRAAPDDCAMIGDTSSDFEAARENGVFSIGVAWGYGTPDELAQADVVCSSPGRLASSLA